MDKNKTLRPRAGRVDQCRHLCTFKDTFETIEAVDEQLEVFPKTPEESAKIYNTIQKYPLYQLLSIRQVEKFIEVLQEISFMSGDLVFRQGDKTDRAFVVKSGVYEGYVNRNNRIDRSNLYYEEGAFAERALVTNSGRAASVKALTDGVLWYLEKKTFKKILLLGRVMKKPRVASLLSSVPIFKALKPYEKIQLQDALIVKTFSPGERMVKRGDPSPGIFFVLSGTVSARILVDKKEVEVWRIKKNDFVGLIALMRSTASRFSSYALTRVEAAFLDSELFFTILAPCLDMFKRILIESDAITR